MTRDSFYMPYYLAEEAQVQAYLEVAGNAVGKGDYLQQL